MWEFLSKITVFERTFILILASALCYFALRILSKKTIRKDKDGLEISDSNPRSSGKKGKSILKPVWSLVIDDSEIGIYSIGNWTTIYGDRWNSAIHKEGYSAITKLPKKKIEISENEFIDFDFWVFDLTNTNVQSQLLSILVDISKEFDSIIVLIRSENSGSVKTISPEYSVQKNIRVVKV